MLDTLESLRRIIYRWVKTATHLTANLPPGSSILTVDSSLRFRVGDKITICDSTNMCEPVVIISEIIDNKHIRLVSPITSDGWTLSTNPIVYKVIHGQFVKDIYLGDPTVIPRFPAISIMGNTRSSEWLTLGTTKERREVQIIVYVEDSTQEEGYRFLLEITDTIQHGLKKNIFPLVGPYNTTNLIVDAVPTDEFLKVRDTSILGAEHKIVLESKYRAEELRILEVIDSQTIQVFPLVNNPYLVADDSKVIALTRFIFNSWPATIEYGFVHKNTLLKAASISWFAEEQEVQTHGGWSDPQLS